MSKDIFFSIICQSFRQAGQVLPESLLSLMLLVAIIWPIQNNAKKAGKSRKPWQMGTHMIVLIKSFPMHINRAGFERFSKFSRSCAFDESSILSIERVKRRYLHGFRCFLCNARRCKKVHMIYPLLYMECMHVITLMLLVAVQNDAKRLKNV